MIALDVEVEAEGWRALGDAAALCGRAAQAALAASGQEFQPSLAATILLTDDGSVRELNRAWRGQDRPTNVLSFPAPALPSVPRFLGDIALAYETVAREAADEGKTVADHAAHLVVHGLLHLLGHDHIHESDAARMEEIEVTALRNLGIADPYRTAA